MKKIQLSLLFTLGLVLAFQGCSKNISFVSAESLTAIKSENNGDGYTGKPTPYDFRSAEQACLEKGANGKPLPNSQIFIFPIGGAQLVRENCVDITPKPLSPDQYSLNSNGDLIFQNQTFTKNLDTQGFSVVAAACPAGRTPIANAVRTSLSPPPLYLQDTSWQHPGLTIDWVGSLASLPLYKLERTDPDQLANWHRLAMSIDLNSQETYVYSFFAKMDPLEKVEFVAFYPNNHDLQIQFDLLTGAANVVMSKGVNLIATKAQALSGGLFINVYFQVLSNSSTNIGFSSVGENLGSSILATAAQFEPVSNYCLP